MDNFSLGLLTKDGLTAGSLVSVLRSSGTSDLQPARLPNTRQEAVPYQRTICWPSGVVREHSLFRVNAIEQGSPASKAQEHCAEIPFLKVVSDIADHVGEIHRVPNESVRSRCRQPAQRRSNSEESAQRKETAKTQARSEHY